MTQFHFWVIEYGDTEKQRKLIQFHMAMRGAREFLAPLVFLLGKAGTTSKRFAGVVLGGNGCRTRGMMYTYA
jgi:hypothetical protein